MLKIKNNMLTAVLMVTTLPGSVPVSLELVEQICYTVGRAVAEMNEVSPRCDGKIYSFNNFSSPAHGRRNTML